VRSRGLGPRGDAPKTPGRYRAGPPCRGRVPVDRGRGRLATDPARPGAPPAQRRGAGARRARSRLRHRRDSRDHRDRAARAPPPPPADPPALARDGWRIAPAGAELALDGDLETLWRGSVEWTPDRLTVDLGETATVSAVALDLGRHLRLYLRSYRVEGSDDGE